MINKSEKIRNIDWLIRLVTFFLIVVIVFTVIKLEKRQNYELQNYDVGSYSTENLQLYFTPSEENIAKIVETLNTAEREIHCALRSLNYELLENTLIKKEESGLKVRLFIDSDYMGNKRIYLPYTKFADPSSGAMMHSNYCVIDDEVVLTGSLIFNKNTLSENFHDFLIINSPVLADSYSSDFWKLYTNQSFQSKRVVERKSAIINEGVSAKPCFAPYEDCKALFVDVINKANTSIFFAVYAFTDQEIYQALVEARLRGVEIFGVIDSNGVNEDTADYESINKIRVKVGYPKVHTKMFIIDDELVIEGTLNPTYRGFNINNENALFLRNRELAEVYKEFNSHIYRVSEDQYIWDW